MKKWFANCTFQSKVEFERHPAAMSLQRSNSTPDSPTLPAESPTSSEASSSPREPCNLLLFESYLYKMPPLKKSILMVSRSVQKVPEEKFEASFFFCGGAKLDRSLLLFAEMVQEMVHSDKNRPGKLDCMQYVVNVPTIWTACCEEKSRAILWNPLMVRRVWGSFLIALSTLETSGLKSIQP